MATAAATPPLFTPQHLATLKRCGAVVVKGVLNAQECHSIHQSMLEYFARWNPLLTPNAPDNWRASVLPPGVHGLNQFDGQQPFCWRVRQHPRVVQTFAELYKCQPTDLLTSMDGFRFLIHGRNYQRGNHWGHTDEGPWTQAAHPDYVCVQASVAITSSAHPEDGDFVYWEAGHRAHKTYFQRASPEILAKMRKAKDNWHVFPEEFLKQIEQDGREWLQPDDPQYGSAEPVPMRRVRLQRQAGDMVFWYSTTPHQSQAPGSKAPHDAAAIFVSMAPRKFAAPGDLDKRIKAFEEMRTTSHWPVQHLHLFAKNPRVWSTEQGNAYRSGLERVRIFPHGRHTLSPLGQSLVGYRTVNKTPPSPSSSDPEEEDETSSSARPKKQMKLLA